MMKDTMNTMKTGALAVLFAMANVAQATPLLEAFADVKAFSPGQNPDRVTDTAPPSSHSAGASAVTAVNGANAGAAAEAEMGIVRAHAYGNSEDAVSGSYAYSRARFVDGITLINDELTGQTGEVTLGFYYDYSSRYTGATSALSTSNGNVEISAIANDQYAMVSDTRHFNLAETRTFFRDDARGLTSTFDGYTGMLYLTTQFQWGVAFDIALEVSAQGGTDSREALALGVANATQGAYWDGVQSITSNGSVIDSFRIVSESGTDYSQSFAPPHDIPEPAGYLLLLAGAGMMVSVRRLKRR